MNYPLKSLMFGGEIEYKILTGQTLRGSLIFIRREAKIESLFLNTKKYS